MSVLPEEIADFTSEQPLPETPHELPIDRGRVDEMVEKARAGARFDLLSELLHAVDWSAFAGDRGEPLDDDALDSVRQYYRLKWGDIGPLFLAELLSTEFMTEQRARGDVVFSERLLQLGRGEPELWQEIRHFFRRKEMVTALLASAHDASASPDDDSTSDDEEEDLWE